MTASIGFSETRLVALPRESLAALTAALFRDVGAQAAALLQEAGFAGGPALYDAFGTWLAGRGFAAPDALPASAFAERATEFFRDAGWGSLALGALGGAATLDSVDWAESDAARRMDFPGCYYTSGLLADFFGRLAGQPVAVMEVECRSMGGARCRFLVGSGDTMQQVYDAMGAGVGYAEALAAP